MDKEKAFFLAYLYSALSIPQLFCLLQPSTKEEQITFVTRSTSTDSYKLPELNSGHSYACGFQAGQTSRFPKKRPCFSQAFRSRVHTLHKVISIATPLKNQYSPIYQIFNSVFECRKALSTLNTPSPSRACLWSCCASHNHTELSRARAI